MTNEELAPGIRCLPVRIPGPLKFVNCYLFRGAKGWDIVDAGFFGAESPAVWSATLRELEIRPGDIRSILITHHHPDHLGGARWLQELTGAPVLMPAREVELADLTWNPERGQVQAATSHLLQHGMPPAWVQELESHYARAQAEMLPLPEMKPLAAGQTVDLGDRTFSTIPTPGHSDGLAVFWDAEGGLLVASDVILERITPNVGWWPHHARDPLHDYLASLDRLQPIPARLTLTGHREPVRHLARRAMEIQAHHRERLSHLTAALAAVPQGLTAWEAYPTLFGDLHNAHNLRFAFGETLAHLEYLHRQGQVDRLPGPPVRFRVVRQ